MGQYQDAVTGTIDEAVQWAGESTRLWLEWYARMVDDAATSGAAGGADAGGAGGASRADVMARDLATMTAAGARDAARVVATWVKLGNALVGLDLGQGGGGQGGGGQGGGGQGSGGQGGGGQGGGPT